MINKHEIISKLYPQIAIIRGDEAFDIDGNKIEYDMDLVQSELDATAYIDKRAAEYPSIVDQLDLLYHGGLDAWKDAIKAVKDKYPKGVK